MTSNAKVNTSTRTAKLQQLGPSRVWSILPNAAYHSQPVHCKFTEASCRIWIKNFRMCVAIPEWFHRKTQREIP